jgi:hypothetical protein
MEKEIKQVNDHYRKNYFDDEAADRIKAKVHQDIKQIHLVKPEKKKGSFNLAKKISYVTAACLVLFGLFIGSAFISPAMAEMASKIPYLSKIFKQDPAGFTLIDVLRDQGYNVVGVGEAINGEKTIVISVDGTEEYYNEVKDDIEKVAKDVYKSRGYDAYDFEVKRANNHNPVITNPEQVAESEKVMEVLLEKFEQLKDKNFNILSHGAGYKSPTSTELVIEVTIPDSEKRTDELKEAIEESLIAADISDFKIKFYKVNLAKKEIEGKWTSEVFPVIREGLMGKKEFKMTGYAYSFKDDTMRLFIKTSIDGSDKNATEHANKIELAIHEFLESDELKDIVDKSPYKVVVRDKDGKEIK